jgi:hypothetical protein
MTFTRRFRVPVFKDGHVRGRVHFCETEGGKFVLQSGPGSYGTTVYDTLIDAIIEFRDRLQEEHTARADGVLVTCGQPIEAAVSEPVRIDGHNQTTKRVVAVASKPASTVAKWTAFRSSDWEANEKHGHWW